MFEQGDEIMLDVDGIMDGICDVLPVVVDIGDRFEIGVTENGLLTVNPEEKMLNGWKAVELTGKLISEPRWKGIDNAPAEAESVNNANIINITLNPLIYNTPFNIFSSTKCYANLQIPH